MSTVLIRALLVGQSLALLVLLRRLWPGRTRRPPTPPHPGEVVDTTVTVIVATLNEAARIAPCLAGLRAQGRPLLEVLVVDSRSTDGTRALVEAAAALDPRVRLLTDRHPNLQIEILVTSRDRPKADLARRCSPWGRCALKQERTST